MEKDKIIEHIILIIKELHICGRNKNAESLNDLFENYATIIQKKEKLALELTENLKLIMPIDNKGSITELMTYLYSAKKFKIEIIDQILEENNYEENLAKFVRQMGDRIIDGEKLEGMSKSILEILFATNIISGPIFSKEDGRNIKYIFINYINKMFLSGKDTFSYECISKTIENLTEVMGNVNGLNTACYIVPGICLNNDDSISTMGIAEEQFVYLNEDIIKDYYLRISLSVFNTVFHELAHINQNRRHEGLLPIVPQVDLKQMKEVIIRKVYPKYYDLNYDIISSEKEATILGHICSERYLNSLGFSLIDKDEMKKKIDNEIKKNENELRTIDGNNIYTIDELFLKAINERKELLDKFSVLRLLYKEDNEAIIPLSDEEIKHNFEVKKHNRDFFNFSDYEVDFEVLNYMVNGGNDAKNR